MAVPTNSTNLSSRPGGSDSGRLSDLDHTDELDRMKARMHGLCLAAAGMEGGLGPEFRAGLYQMIIDVTEAMIECARAFTAERNIRLAEMGGARG